MVLAIRKIKHCKKEGITNSLYILIKTTTVSDLHKEHLNFVYDGCIKISGEKYEANWNNMY